MSLKLKLVAATLVASMATTTAYAQNNNTGQIVIQGVVPGVWELTVYDITSGYDFDLSTAASATSDARVGTIHIAQNLPATVGINPNVANIDGMLVMESANGGRMVNDQSLAGAAADAMDYRLSLVEDVIAGGSGNMDVLYDPNLTLGNLVSIPTDGSIRFNMNTTLQLQFASGVAAGAGGDEATYDVVFTLGDGDGTIDNRPQSSGVYSDTLTFIIMDDS